MSKYDMYRLWAAGFAVYESMIIVAMVQAARANVPYLYRWQGLLFSGKQLAVGPTKWRIAASIVSVIGLVLWVSGFVYMKIGFGIASLGLGVMIAVDFIHAKKVGSDEPPPIPPATIV